jgi:D-inositol-3-phosphate glycosyltransferase
VADGVSGVLVEGHDPAIWADVLGRLLDDPVARERLASGAVAHAQQFGWASTAASMLNVYADALDRNQRSAAADEFADLDRRFVAGAP